MPFSCVNSCSSVTITSFSLDLLAVLSVEAEAEDVAEGAAAAADRLREQHGRQKNGKFAFHRFSSSKFVTYCKLKWKLRTTQTLWYNGFTTKHISPKKEGSHDEIIPYLVSKMQQKSFILSLRQKSWWVLEVSLQEGRLLASYYHSSLILYVFLRELIILLI